VDALDPLRVHQDSPNFFAGSLDENLSRFDSEVLLVGMNLNACNLMVAVKSRTCLLVHADFALGEDHQCVRLRIVVHCLDIT